MKITLSTPSSTALDSITLNSANDSAEVVFKGSRKYTYAINFGKSGYNDVQQIADEISTSPSVGSKFNQLVKNGTFTPIVVN